MTETDGLNAAELYKELGILTKDKGRWKESMPYVASLLTHDSVKIQAKALWLLGEMGFAYPLSVQDAVPVIADFLDSPEPLMRERAVNALGRIGRGDYSLIESYWIDLFRFASDEDEGHMPVFEKMLNDPDDKVRMEAPEIFRVLGRRNPEFVMPYLDRLRQISETDENRVVRIHSLGAIKATVSKQKTSKG